ncbi:MAG: cytochrome c553 [Desulforhopalus sp.]|jgi:cytochrome c553
MKNNNMQERKAMKKTWILNIIFAVACIGIFVFLLRAPEETTAFLPKDDLHAPFHLIKSKKAAEKTCLDCHGPEGDAPLQEGHPPKYRCLFCHKRG